ncbi:MAG: hypothetical protein ACR2RF_11075 [Geminicoccaceae bacterium]
MVARTYADAFQVPCLSPHKIPKAHYAVKKWHVYEAALRQRGDIRIRIGEDVEVHWTVPGKRTPKGYPVCTDLAIETVLTLLLSSLAVELGLTEADFN